MSQLIEITRVRQVAGESPRRWFASDELDLYVWCDEGGAPTGFQLCYDKLRSERALTWKPELGFDHTAVDDGETQAGVRHKSTPILIVDGHFDANAVIRTFRASCARLPAGLVEFVAAKLREHPSFLPATDWF